MENKKINERQLTVKNCFLITPIGKKKSIEFDKVEALKKNVYEKILGEFDYKLIIAHTINEPGSIGDQVFKKIIESDLIIANLTGLNPNVMYEIAVAHSFGIPTVMICENGTNLPFDLISDRTIFYDDTIEGCGYLKSELKEKIESLETNPNIDNPVFRILDRIAVKNDLLNNQDPDKRVQATLFDLQDQIASLSQKVGNQFIDKPFINTPYEAVENIYNASIGDYGTLVISQANLVPEKHLGDLINKARKMALELDRMPTLEELRSEVNISKRLLNNIEFVC